MQFHTRTLLMVLATFAVALTLTTPGGAWVQTAALVSVAVAWLGVLIAALVCDASQPRVGRDIFLLTLGFFLVVLGGLSACFCVGLSAKKLFTAGHWAAASLFEVAMGRADRSWLFAKESL